MAPRMPHHHPPSQPEPSEPGLILAADVADISRVVFLYDPAVIDPRMAWADLGPIDQAGLLTQLPMPLPGADGWETFGLMVQLGGLVNPGGAASARLRMQVGMPRWILALQWRPVRSAWDALLDAQDQHQPERLSLVPWLIMPLIFIARMRAFPLGPFVGGDTAAQWLPHLAVAQRKLQPLMTSLYALWVHGPTERAAAYRGIAAAPLAPMTAAQERLVHDLARLVDDAPLAAIRAAHHPEPGIIRLLDQASARLWELDDLRMALSADLLAGLLPIARWRPDPPGPPTSDIPRSNSELLRWWRDWVTKRRIPPAHPARRFPAGQGPLMDELQGFVWSQREALRSMAEAEHAAQGRGIIQLLASPPHPRMGRGVIQMLFVPRDAVAHIAQHPAGPAANLALLDAVDRYDPAAETLVLVIETLPTERRTLFQLPFAGDLAMWLEDDGERR